MSDATPAKSRPSKKTPGRRGGFRPGAGRKPSKVKEYGRQLDAAIAALARAMGSGSVAELGGRAEVGHRVVSEAAAPAESITRDEVLLDADGKPRVVKRPAFPDAKPGEMIVTRRVVEVSVDFRYAADDPAN